MLLTALANPQDIFKGLESGADYYCLKPYKVPVLLGRLRSILADASTQYAPSAQPGTDVTYGGQKYSIHAGRNQILGLLLATFETIAQKNKELAETNQKLTEALDTNFTLRSLIPICGHCKKIRDDQGYWDQVENFVTRHYDARFTHDICPQCAAKTKAAWQQPKQNPPKT
jgi:two-component system cell cycle response regulator